VFYSFDIPIPANTAEDNPEELVADLTYGVITHVELEFPPGCAGLAKVAILHRRHQIWPTNIDKWFYTDGRIIAWDDYFELLEPPFQLVILGYNDDDTFEHTPIIRFEELYPTAAMAKYGVYEGVVSIKSIPVEVI